MSKRRKYIFIGLGLTIALLLFSITLLPLIVRHKAIASIQEVTGRDVRLDSVTINPLTLTVTLNGFAIEQKGGAPLLSLKELRASLALASLYKRALILSHITIDAPAISFVRTAPNRYSFSDITDKLQAAPKKEENGAFLFSINNIVVKDGSLEFDDRLIGGGRKHSIRDLQITLPFISNIPYLAEKYTDPKITALVNGAPFNFAGKLKPLSKSMETSVRIDLKHLSLPEYMAYLPVKPAVDLTSGYLTIDTDLNYRISADKKPELAIKGTVNLDNLQVDIGNGKPLLKLPAFKTVLSKADVFSQRFEMESVVLDRLELFVSRDARGEWVWSKLLPPKPSKEQAASETKTGPKNRQPEVSVGSFACTNASIHIADALPAGGFFTLISPIDIKAKDFNNAPGKKAAFAVSLVADRDTQFKAEADLAVNPVAATTQFKLSGLPLQRGWPYIQRYLTSPISGIVDLSGSVNYDGISGVTLQKGGLQLKGLAARNGKERFDLALVEVHEAAFSQKQNRLEIASVKLSKGDLAAAREADGRISWLSMLKSPAQAPATRPVAAQAAGKNKGEQPALSYKVNLLQLDRFNVALTDRSREEEPRFTLRNTNLTLKNLQGPKFTPAGLHFSTSFGRNATVKASGELTPLPFHYKGGVSVKQLPVRDFEPYFPDSLNIFVIGGLLDTAMHADLRLKDGKPYGSFAGDLGIRAFHCVDTTAEEDLLKWESLQFDEVKGELEPFSLKIRQVALNNAYARVMVRKDGTLNLQNLVEKDPAEGATAGTSLASISTKAAPSAQTKPAISVDSVTIQDSTLAFSDHHLSRPFSSTFFNLGGRVSGLSSEQSRLADLDLRGNLENHSPLQITGKLNPLRDDLFADLKISFRDIDLSPATPYSGTYLGYAVDKGKLFLDLKYLIEKKQLNSENRVFVDQFTFGNKVESDKATNLPVRLAVALLKDRKGEIHLDLPVTGRTDDPKFSVWGVIGQVLKNLLVKAATSPFALLSSMMGNAEDFSMIQFAAGATRLGPDEQRKLQQLAKALAERPGLKVEIKGFVDQEKDPEGFRSEQLDHKLRREKFLAMAKEQLVKEGDSADTVQIANHEYPALLKAVYKKEKFPKPRNMLGVVKDLPDSEMKKLIIANMVVGEAELQSLARDRSAAVINYLISQGLPAERLFQKNDDIHKQPTQGRRARVEFNAIAQ